MGPPRDACRRPVGPPENGSSIRLPRLCSHGRRFQTEATVLVRWYRWPLLSIGEADPTLWGGGTGPGWVSTARVAARGRCDGGRPAASSGASNLTPGGALSSTYLSLRWSPWTAGGAGSSRAMSDVMPKQWRVEWTALAGCAEVVISDTPSRVARSDACAVCAVRRRPTRFKACLRPMSGAS